jgi:tetratricopeptide (TPR) repeat protein
LFFHGHSISTVAVDLYRAIGHRRGEAISIRGIGLVHRAAGDLDAAAENVERAHEIGAEIGDRLLLCYTGQALAKVWLRQGHAERGRPILEAALDTCTVMRDRLGVALIRRTIGELHLVTGDRAEALRQLRLAEDAWRDMDLDLWRARTLRDLGAAYALGGDCAPAHHSWQEAAIIFARLGTRERTELPDWRRRWGCECDLTAPTG